MDKSIREYLSAIGRRGGSSKSPRKAAASRENGKKNKRIRQELDRIRQGKTVDKLS